MVRLCGFGAAIALVFSIAFKQDLTLLIGTILIFSAKVRLMLYGMARWGVWQSLLMYLGATAAMLAVFFYANGQLWK